MTWDTKIFIMLPNLKSTLKSTCKRLTSNERTSMEDEDLDLWTKLNNSLHSFICQTGTATHVHLLHNNVNNRCEHGQTTACTVLSVRLAQLFKSISCTKHSINDRCKQCLNNSLLCFTCQTDTAVHAYLLHKTHSINNRCRQLLNNRLHCFTYQTDTAVRIYLLHKTYIINNRCKQRLNNSLHCFTCQTDTAVCISLLHKTYSINDTCKQCFDNSLHHFTCKTGTAAEVHLLHLLNSVNNRCEQC